MNGFWIELDVPGRLSIMTRPHGGDQLKEDLALLKSRGIDVLVSLLEPHEAEKLGLAQEQTICDTEGLEYFSLPIRDHFVPVSQRRVYELALTLAKKLENGKKVIVHCRGGKGRSGIIAAAIMIVLGVDVDDALARLHRARGRRAPGRKHQIEWVRRFADEFESYFDEEM